jgi:hypothetical protein
MDRKTTLFDVPQKRLREIQRSLSSLDIQSARQGMDNLLKQYPDHPEVRREEAVVQFLYDTFIDMKKPAQLFTQFSSLKKLLKEYSYVPEYLPDLGPISGASLTRREKSRWDPSTDIRPDTSSSGRGGSMKRGSL